MADDQLVADQEVEDGFAAGIEASVNPAPASGMNAEPKAAKEKPAAGTKAKPDAKPAAEKGAKDEAAPAAIAKPEDKPKPAPAAKPEDDLDELTAEERMAQRAKEIEDADAAAAAKPPDAPPAAQRPSPAAPAAPASAPKPTEKAPAPDAPDSGASLSLTDDDLKGIVIQIDGKDTSLADAKAMLPEIVDIATAIANAALKKGGMKSPAAAAPSADDPVMALRQQLEAVQLEMENRRFFEDIISGFTLPDGTEVQGHSDAHQIARSANFKAWVKKQSPGVKAMAQSLDRMDGVTLLDAYKEMQMKAVGSAPTDRHSRRVSQLREVAPGGKTAGPAKSSEDDDGADDKEAGFREALEGKK